MSKIVKKKYENAILYLCNAVGGALYGKKKLAKLLYYVDFDRYEFNESEKSVTGDTYKAWKMGPVPQTFSEVIDDMQKKGSLSVEEREQSAGYLPTSIYRASKKPDLNVFDDDDLKILQHVAVKYGRLTGKQLEDLTHAEAPYIGTQPNGEIIYELAFYRGTDFSDVVATTR
jgi:uncharacterized phage-associated protein